MRTLFVGDIHAKNWIIDKVRLLTPVFDKIVFLGDIVDDWNATPKESAETLRNLIDLHEEHRPYIHILFGNHDLSEWLGGEWRCAGYNSETSSMVKEFFQREYERFDIAYGTHGFLCTHGGLTSGWYKQMWSGKHSGVNEIAEELKQSFFCGDDGEEWQQSGVRGGGKNPSPIWCDKSELMASPKPKINQIVGHTPVRHIAHHEFVNGDRTRNHLFFCDTFSTYRDGTPYGDQTMLAIDDRGSVKIWSIIDIDGNILSTEVLEDN